MSNNQQTAQGHFIGYVRVSTGEQHDSGLGLDAQRTAIRQACAGRSWELGAIHQDTASGRTLAKRPGLQEAMQELIERRAAGLVVAKLDRLSRSIVDFVSLMDASRRQGWALVALDVGVDSTTPAGEMVCHIMSSFAQYERRLIGQRTSAALAELKEQGVKLGRPRSISDSSLSRLLALREDGMSYRAMADQLNAEGVPTGQGGQWHHTTVYRALQSRS